jgi:hypothetical protein
MNNFTVHFYSYLYFIEHDELPLFHYYAPGLVPNLTKKKYFIIQKEKLYQLNMQ